MYVNNSNKVVDKPKRKGYDLTMEPAAKQTRKPTIYEALTAKLGRVPTHSEITADVRRILSEVTVELAGKGKLPHQRRK